MLLYMTYIASHTIINCIIAGVLVTEAAYFGQLVHPCNRQLTHTCIFFFLILVLRAFFFYGQETTNFRPKDSVTRRSY